MTTRNERRDRLRRLRRLPPLEALVELGELTPAQRRGRREIGPCLQGRRDLVPVASAATAGLWSEGAAAERGGRGGRRYRAARRRYLFRADAEPCRAGAAQGGAG
jgi:hypothetical protein